MYRSIIIFLLFAHTTCLAQYTISGKVIGLTDKNAVANASVFLNNASVGSKSADNGEFTLTGVRPGQYDLVVSIIGYETFHEQVIVNGDIAIGVIEISPKIILLKEVSIKPNHNWARDYETFKRLFLGTSDYSAQCRILNPELLDLDYDPSKRLFKATSSDFLEIENKALGYKIKYLLTDLTNDYKTGILYYEGSATFEELKGSNAQQRKWQKNRLKAYEGSSMHFFRSTIGGNIAGEGFKVLRLIRKRDPDHKFIESLVTTPLSVNDFVKRTDITGQFVLSFNDCLYVLYSKKKKDKPVSPTLNVPDYLNDPLTTTILFQEPYAYFDFNGIIINPRSIIFNGAWGNNRIGELLPVDYVPKKAQ